MAKINPANVAPDAYPRVRGVLLTRTTEHGLVAQAWPKKRGPSKTSAQIFLTKQFSLAAQYAANTEPIQWETAEYLSRDTVWMPRDILVMAAYGKLYELRDPTGQLYTQASHAAPDHSSEGIPQVTQWQATHAQGAYAGTVSSSAFAAKGNTLTPDIEMELFALQMLLTPVNNAVYNVFVCRLNGSNVIQSIVTGVPRQLTGTVKKLYEFQCSATLAAGVKYAIMLARTDSTNTYVLPVASPTDGNFLIPAIQGTSARIAKAVPLVGDTVDVSATALIFQSLLLNF